MKTKNSYKVIDSHSEKNAHFEHWNNGITYLKLRDNVELTLEDSEAQYNYLKSKYDGVNKFRILVDTGIDTNLSKEAREFSTIPEKNEMTLATAVIVKSIAHRMLINFIIKFIHQQTMKMKMFDEKEKAIEWLLTIK